MQMNAPNDLPPYRRATFSPSTGTTAALRESNASSLGAQNQLTGRRAAVDELVLNRKLWNRPLQLGDLRLGYFGTGNVQAAKFG